MSDGNLPLSTKERARYIRGACWAIIKAHHILFNAGLGAEASELRALTDRMRAESNALERMEGHDGKR